MNIDLLSLSGHKIYGPKGIGALYMRKGLRLENFLHGGRHERDRRGGTENVSGVVGLAKAASLCAQRMESDMARLTDLTETFYTKITHEIPGVQLNGHATKRLPGLVNISFDGVESDTLVLSLDLMGIAVSNGSACASGSVEPSHVIRALHKSRDAARSAIRFSFGRNNDLKDVEVIVAALKEILTRLRRLQK
jgi:cysteine desulfurase